jgi:hypothetical protein
LFSRNENENGEELEATDRENDLHATDLNSKSGNENEFE